jgi:cytochrome P450
MLNTESELPEWPFARTCPADQPPAFEKFRQQPPQLCRLPDGLPAWVVTSYADVKQALFDPRISASDDVDGFRHRIKVPAPPGAHSFWRMDPPEHTRLRKMIMTAFTARAIRELRPRVELLIDELLDKVEAAPKPVDLLDTFAMPLPALVVARVFGVPDKDFRLFVEFSRAILSQQDDDATLAGFLGMSEYLEKLVLAKQKDPTDDLISVLATEQLGTGNLTLDEVVAMVRLLLIAGHETTANQIALSVLTLLHHREQYEALQRDPGLLDSFIEESLRYWSMPQDNILRTVIEEVDVGGTLMRPGDLVVISIPAANHDDRVFECPGQFEMTRDASDHLAFGIGPHYCPGAPLARAELRLALPKLFERFPTLRLAGPAKEIPFREKTLVFGVEQLMVTW